MEDRGSERRTKRDVEAREAAANEHRAGVHRWPTPPPTSAFLPSERILLASPCPQHARYSVHAVRERVHLRSLIAISR